MCVHINAMAMESKGLNPEAAELGKLAELSMVSFSNRSRISQTGTPSIENGTKNYYLARFFAKTAWKLKKLVREGARAPPQIHQWFFCIWIVYFLVLTEISNAGVYQARCSILYIIFRYIFGSPLTSHSRVYSYFVFENSRLYSISHI